MFTWVLGTQSNSLLVGRTCDRFVAYIRPKMRPSGWLGSQNIWFFDNNHSIQFRVRRLRLLAKCFPIEPFLNPHSTIHGKPFSMAYPNSVALLMLMCIRLTETILHQTVDTDSLKSCPWVASIDSELARIREFSTPVFFSGRDLWGTAHAGLSRETKIFSTQDGSVFASLDQWHPFNSALMSRLSFG